MKHWLHDAVFYEIYPQTFFDSNGDGIGDIPGITAKLPYIASLGCNALWLNPCFVSPFGDAGYDVADYCRVAPRYGTNEDLAALFAAAHDRGMHVLLDLVPGHTSIEHPWFKEAAGPRKTNTPAGMSGQTTRGNRSPACPASRANCAASRSGRALSAPTSIPASRR